MLLSRITRIARTVVPAAAGLLACALWLHLRIHLGIDSRLDSVSRGHLDPTTPQLLLVLWITVAGAVALAPPAFRRAPLPTPAAWRAERPLTIEDRLAAATFGAYAANRAAKTVEQCLAYRSVGPILVALGGPAGDPAAARAAEATLRRHAGRRPVVWYGTGTGGRGALRFGQEAIVRPERHDLASPRLANLRHSVARARRAGLQVARAAWPDLPQHLREQLKDLECEATRRRRLPLTLTVSRLSDARDGRRWSLATHEGRVEAAVTWLPGASQGGAVLDILWRRRDAVPGAVELLIEQEIERARTTGEPWLSLGVCGDPDQPAWMRGLNPPGLRRFKAKFAPEWHDRYVVAPALPRPLALAAVALAHLLPPRSGPPS